MNSEIATIPSDPMFDQTASLSRCPTGNLNGKMKDFSGIRLTWDNMIGAFDINTHIIKETEFDLYLYGGQSSSVMSTKITEEQLVKMLSYVQSVKSQMGKKLDLVKSFENHD